MLETELNVDVSYTTSAGVHDYSSKSSETVQALTSFNELYPALLQCFALITSGYLASKLKIISVTENRGIRNLVIYFLTPAIIIKSLLELQFNTVDWRFLGCIVAAKCTLFLTVSALTLVISRSFGKAGIYGIFVTQSNDLALGMLIINALYKTSHPEFSQYLYLFVPISLLVLNPIGFLFMEIEKYFDGNKETTSSFVMIRHILVAVFKNPVVFTTFIGLFGNIASTITGIPPPAYLLAVLEPFAVAFVPAALFCLGSSLVGCFKPSTLMFVTPTLLVLTKILLLPLVIREFLEIFNPGSDADTRSLHTFGFLYGTLPTSPTVYVYASYYGVSIDKIATGMALCTFISIPWIFLSARMITIPHVSQPLLIETLKLTHVNISVIGLVSSVWMLVVLISEKRRKLVQLFLLSIIICCLLNNTGALLLQVGGPDSWKIVLMTIHLTGYFGSFCWVAMLAILLTTLKLCPTYEIQGSKAKRLFMTCCLVGFGIALITAIVVTADGDKDHHNLVASDGLQSHSEAMACIVMLSICAITTVTCIVMHQWTNIKEVAANVDKKRTRAKRKRKSGFPHLEDQLASSALLDSSASEDEASLKLRNTSLNEEDIEITMECLNSAKPAVGEIIQLNANGPGPLDSKCGSDSDRSDNSGLREILRSDVTEDVELDSPGPSSQVLKTNTVAVEQSKIFLSAHDDVVQTEVLKEHLKYLLFNLISLIAMVVSAFVHSWQIIGYGSKHSGTLMQLKLLDIVLSNGLGFFLLLLFGFQGNFILTPLIRRLKKWWQGSDKLVLPSPSELDHKTRGICKQFAGFHMKRFRSDCAAAKRNLMTTQRHCFYGPELVNWLMALGLVSDRTEGEKYGRRLVLGRVIEHVKQEEQFHDSNNFMYRFVKLGSYSIGTKLDESSRC